MEKYFIVDASCIIILTKIQASKLIKKLLSKGYRFIISKEVKEEVTDINSLIEEIDDDNLIVDVIPDRCIYDQIDMRYPMLGKGEKSVLSIYQQNVYSPQYAILDDGVARRKADDLGIKKHGTLWLIEKAFFKCLIMKETAICYLNKILRSRFRIDPALIMESIRKISQAVCNEQ